jgi:AraC-like DNA-binding protein
MPESVIGRLAMPGSFVPQPLTYVADGLAVRWCGAGCPLPEAQVTCPSIHLAWDGRVPLRVNDRELRLDDDVFIVLNAGRRIGPAGPSDSQAKLLSVYFAPQRVLQAVERRGRSARGGDAQHDSLEFLEHLREHDRPIASVMRYLAHHVREGVADQEWYEEQILFLLRRLLESEAAIALGFECMTRIRPARRRDAFARLARVTDLIHSAYERPLGVDDFAKAADWSPLHTLRRFKSVHGVDPYEYLQRRRARAAARLLETTDLSESQVAKHVGFGERSALLHRLRVHALAASHTERASIGQAMYLSADA